ncbi:MAG: hypothetical protein WC058_06560 [Phycisphaeraceae bacterium]
MPRLYPRPASQNCTNIRSQWQHCDGHRRYAEPRTRLPGKANVRCAMCDVFQAGAE